MENKFMLADIINKICKPNKENPIVQETKGCIEYYDELLKQFIGEKFDSSKMENALSDPDTNSSTLRDFHQLLWSKELPNGEKMELKKYKNNGLKWGKITFGSDSIGTGFIWGKYQEKLKNFHQNDANFLLTMHNFTLYCYTLGAFIIFPKHKNSINQVRGRSKTIVDRIDLTLNCIRKFYIGGENELCEVLKADAKFFNKFGKGIKGFESYVKFFLLDDLIKKDGTIDFFLDHDGYPENIDEYNLYREKSIIFIKKRNERIAQELEKILNEKVQVFL